MGNIFSGVVAEPCCCGRNQDSKQLDTFEKKPLSAEESQFLGAHVLQADTPSDITPPRTREVLDENIPVFVATKSDDNVDTLQYSPQMEERSPIQQVTCWEPDVEPRSPPKSIWDRIDSNQDGQITGEEFSQALRAGIITEEEFQNAANAMRDLAQARRVIEENPHADHSIQASPSVQVTTLMDADGCPTSTSPSITSRPELYALPPSETTANALYPITQTHRTDAGAAWETQSINTQSTGGISEQSYPPIGARYGSNQGSPPSTTSSLRTQLDAPALRSSKEECFLASQRAPKSAPVLRSMPALQARRSTPVKQARGPREPFGQPVYTQAAQPQFVQSMPAQQVVSPPPTYASMPGISASAPRVVYTQPTQMSYNAQQW